MRNGEPYTTEKRTSTKGDGKEATLVAQVRVEETPRDSDCGPGKASGKAPQSGHAVSELDCRDGNKRQQMAVSMWSLQWAHRGVLRAVWIFLAVWLVRLRTTTEAKIASSVTIPQISEGQGQRQGQEWWEGGSAAAQKFGRHDNTKDSENVGVGITGFSQTLYNRSQGECGREGEDGLYSGESFRGSCANATTCRSSSTSFDVPSQRCCRRKSKCRRSFTASNEGNRKYIQPRSSRFQRCTQVWPSACKSSGENQKGIRDLEEDEGRLEQLDQTGSRALQSQSEAIRRSTSSMDFGTSRCTHCRESGKEQLEGVGTDPTELDFGGDRARREGLPGGLRCGGHGNGRGVYGTEGNVASSQARESTSPHPRDPCEHTGSGFVEQIGRCSKSVKRKRRKRESKREGKRKEKKEGGQQCLRELSKSHEDKEGFLERLQGHNETEAVAIPAQRQWLCTTWRRGKDRRRVLKDYIIDLDITAGRDLQPLPPFLNEKELQAQLIINEFSYTDAFRARVETLRQQRRAAEDFGDEQDEGEESEEEEGDDDRGRTPEEQRDLEASVVYFSQGFRVLLLRHRALVGDDLHQVLHIPAQWPASRTVSAIEGLWRDLATKQWLLLYARDPTRDSMAIRPGEIAALVVARDELPPNEIPIAQEIDLTAHSTTFRQQEISQEFRTPLNSRGRLLKKSGYYDYCDASRTERRWHCYVFVDGVAWMDEIERTLKPASHVLIRINPRQDLPADEFLFVQGETTSFAVTHFPLRTIYTTVAFHRPWTITADTLLEDYNRQTWFLHDLGRSTVNWWTVWRHIHGDRTVLTFIQTPTRQEAWKTLDAITKEWNDLATALWEMVEPNQYWRQSPTLRDNDFLVLLLNDVDTAKDDSLIVCEFLPSWQAWLANVHRILTYDEACQLFWEEGMQIDQFQRGQLWLNGVIQDREAGDLRMDHGDILSFSCPQGVHLWDSEGISTGENFTFHETPSSSADPTSTASPTRTTSTGPMSNIVAMPDPPDHGFQPDYHFDNTSAIATFSFTEEFTAAIRLRQQGSVAPFPNFFGRRGADLPDEEEEPPRRNDEENRRLRGSACSHTHGHTGTMCTICSRRLG